MSSACACSGASLQGARRGSSCRTFALHTSADLPAVLHPGPAPRVPHCQQIAERVVADFKYLTTSASGNRRRATGIFVTSSVHVGALLALLHSTVEAPAGRAETITAIDISSPKPAEPETPKQAQPVEVPPQPLEPIVLPPPFIPSENEVVAALLEEAAATPLSGGCDLTAPVQAALQLNPDLELELPTIADERLSVARALAVWKDAWAEPDERLPEKALASIRDTMRQTILAASDDCRMQVQTGPRLVYLTHDAETVTLALGSGEWTWQEVADTADPEFQFPGASVAPQEWTLLEAVPRFLRTSFDGSNGSKPKARPIEQRSRLDRQQEKD
ncbi:hypothetical protein [Tsuneonella sp. HG222]